MMALVFRPLVTIDLVVVVFIWLGYLGGIPTPELTIKRGPRPRSSEADSRPPRV